MWGGAGEGGRGIYRVHVVKGVSQSRYSVKLTFQVDVLEDIALPLPLPARCRGSDFEALVAGEQGSLEGGEGEQD